LAVVIRLALTLGLLLAVSGVALGSGTTRHYSIFDAESAFVASGGEISYRSLEDWCGLPCEQFYDRRNRVTVVVFGLGRIRTQGLQVGAYLAAVYERKVLIVYHEGKRNSVFVRRYRAKLRDW
jgi:hypothetical protein